MDNDGVQKFLDCSTGHLTEKDLKMLDNAEFRNSLPNRFTPHDYGYIIWMPGDEDVLKDAIEELKEIGFSEALAHILIYASQKNCWMINLDRDADQINDLPYYQD